MHTALSLNGDCFMKYQLEACSYLTLRASHMFHSDFAERDTLLPTRFPSSCFLTIKGKVLQHIRSHEAVVRERQVKHSLQTHRGDVMCFHWRLQLCNNSCCFTGRLCLECCDWHLSFSCIMWFINKCSFIDISNSVLFHTRCENELFHQHCLERQNTAKAN